MPTLIVYSHLRWSFVYQRPQHLISRIARRLRVLFVEEPVHDPGAPRLERHSPCPGVEVLRPHTPVEAGGFSDAQLPAVRELVESYLDERERGPLYAWLYTPMALPLAEALQPRKVIYDCMDALTHFRHAPPQLAEREAALLERADVVFCGGTSLYRARAGAHRNVHCFPSSVDAQHFAAGIAEGDHPLQAALPRPRLGYCGVIDERLDLDLLGRMARARPQWQLALVGPVAKIDERDIPALPNVHRFGQQRYEDLPRFMAGWDVGLMPFALNDATRFISPTKTLEYFAAGLAAVSTPITDVAASYAGVVEIAADSETFIAACERVLNEAPAAREQRRAAMSGCVKATSWEKTAGEMWALIEAASGHVRRMDGAGKVERLPERRPVSPPAAADGSEAVANLG